MALAATLSETPDAELALLAAGGSRSAFGALVRRHSSAVRGLLRRMGAEPALADDLAQDAFLIAFERIGSYRGEGAFGGWLKQIAARLYLRRRRRDGLFEVMAEPPRNDADPGPTPGERIDLDEALKVLSEAERLCIALCTGAGFSHPEAAIALQIPEGTVKSHVKRGLEKLRRRMAPDGEPRSLRHG